MGRNTQCRMNNPNKPHQQELIEILIQGKEAWNSWRRQNVGVIANFKGVDFTQIHELNADFQRYEFGDGANFTGARFVNNTDFTHAVFGSRTSFVNANFRSNTSFRKAKFGDGTRFKKVHFHKDADFSDAIFGNDSLFTQCTFHDDANFSNTTFGDYVDLSGTVFSQYSDFEKTKFGSDVKFKKTVFKQKAYFNDADFRNSVYFNEAVFEDNAILTIDNVGGSIFFNQAIFKKYCNLIIENVPLHMNLSYAEFNEIPKLLLQSDDDKVKIDLTAANFSLDKNVDLSTISRIRVLKSVADATASVNESRDLFILQRRAERKLAWQDWKYPIEDIPGLHPLLPTLLAGLFHFFGDYGRSVFRPIAALFIGNAAFLFIYRSLLGTEFTESRSAALRDYTLSNSLPFGRLMNPAFDRAFNTLFGSSDASNEVAIPFLFQLASIGQGVFSVIMLFLIGLGIRNYFKIS